MHAAPYHRRTRGTWIARVFEHGKVARQVTFGTGPEAEAEARDWCDAFNAREERRDAVRNPDPTRPLIWSAIFADYLDTYAPQLSKGSQGAAKSRCHHLRLELGEDDLRDFSQRDLNRLTRDLMNPRKTDEKGKPLPVSAGAHGLGVESTIGVLSTLRRVIRLYGRDIMREDPLREFGSLVSQMRRAAAHGADEDDARDAWSWEEVGTIAKIGEGGVVAPIFLAAIHTGARRGQLLALRWSDVDLKGRRIQFRRQLTAGQEKGLKWRAKGRSVGVPISDALLVELKRLRAGRGEKVVRVGTPAADYVFRSPTGLRWHEGNFTRAWLALRERAARKGVRPFPFHSTRHTFVTWALEAGKSVPWVAAVVSATPEVILRNYAHAVHSEQEDTSFLDGAAHEISPSSRST